MNAVKEKQKFVGARAEIGGRRLAVAKPDGNGRKEQEKASGSPHNGELPEAGRLTCLSNQETKKMEII